MGSIQLIYYFLQSSSEAVNSTFNCLEKLNFWKPRIKSIAIFLDYPNKTEISNIFQKVCWGQGKMLNLVAVIPTDNKVVTVTFNPFVNNFYEVLVGPYVFYNKLKDLNGYLVYLLMIKPDDSTKVKFRTDPISNITKYSGKDGLTILNVLKHINATYSVINLQEIMGWNNPFRSFYRNAKDDAKLEVIRKYNIDIFFLSQEMSNTSSFSEMIYPHGKDDWILMVPQSGFVSQYEFLFSTLKNGLAIVFGFFTIVTTVIWFILQLISNFVTGKPVSKLNLFVLTALDNLRCILGSSLHKTSSHFSNNMFLLFILFCDLIINNYCQSILYSILTVSNRKPQINTISDFINSDLTFITVQNLYNEVKYNFEVTGVKGFVEKMSVVDVLKIPRNFTIEYYAKNTSWLINQDRCEYFSSRRPWFRTTTESILPAYISFHVTKHSPYFDLMETMVPRILESGLYLYWQKATLYETILEEGVIIDEDEGDGYKSLSLHQVRAAVYLWLLGLTISITTFSLEFLFAKFILL